MAAPARLSVQLPEKDLDPANSNDAGGVAPSDRPRLSLAERLMTASCSDGPSA